MFVSRFFSTIEDWLVKMPSLQNVRMVILRFMLVAFSILGLPAVVIGSIEAFSQNHPWTSFLYVSVYLPILFITVFSGKASFRWRSFVLIGGLFILAFSNLLIYGFNGAGTEILLTMCVLATILLGWRVGMINMGGSMVAMIVAGYAFSAGLVEINPILLQTSNSSIAWSTAVVTFLMLAGAMVATTGLVQVFLQHSVEELQIYREHLEGLVAERAQALAAAQERLIRQERLAVIGQLAGGVGHELRNPLGVISNAVYYLNMVIPKTNETEREYLALIQNNTQEATQIVNDLLDFSRVKSVEQSAVNVLEKVEEVLAQYPAPENVIISVNISANLPPVYVDPLHLKQALSNLISNAYQAMLDGGRLTLTARVIEELIEISITDTGTGITPENLDKIFEPLFTTKAKGIGLGLAICKNLVEANNGRIEVQSEAGKGSTFTLYLPAIGSEK